jgi:hypothetical protein
MPSKSPITFSLGQQLKANDTAEPVGSIPVYDYTPRRSWRSAQSTDSTATMPARKQTPESTEATLASDIKIPTGATLRAPIKITLGKGIPRLETRQLWEGIVTQVLNDTFVAILKDKTENKNPEELVTFDFGEIAAEDRVLIRPGSSFYWTIGSERTSGQLKNVSIVQFRRLPVWTRNALANVESRARRIREVFRPQE